MAVNVVFKEACLDEALLYLQQATHVEQLPVSMTQAKSLSLYSPICTTIHLFLEPRETFLLLLTVTPSTPLVYVTSFSCDGLDLAEESGDPAIHLKINTLHQRTQEKRT